MAPELRSVWREQALRVERLIGEMRPAMARERLRVRNRKKDPSKPKKQRIPKQMSLFD